MSGDELPQRGEHWKHHLSHLLGGPLVIEIGPEWDGHYLVKYVGTSHYSSEDVDTILRAFERVKP